MSRIWAQPGHYANPSLRLSSSLNVRDDQGAISQLGSGMLWPSGPRSLLVGSMPRTCMPGCGCSQVWSQGSVSVAKAIRSVTAGPAWLAELRSSAMDHSAPVAR